MKDDRTPVLIGGGQFVERQLPPGLSRGEATAPMDLNARAAEAALADTGIESVRAAVDSVVVLRLISDSTPRRAHDHGRAENPPASVASRLGLGPGRRIYAEIGGNTPQRYLNTLGEEISRGDCEVALVCGAEAMASLKEAERLGVKLDWNESVGDSTLDDRGLGISLATDHERAHGIAYPVHVYPLFEHGIRGQRRASVAEQLGSMAELFAPFSRVAAHNQYAFFPVERTAEELAAVGPRNRFIGHPYPRLLNARDAVDMAAAVIVTSAGRAASLGVPRERWIYLLGCGDADEPAVLERRDYHSCPAIGEASRQALGMAQVGVDDIALFDLYSCFPSAVEIACSELGLDERDARGFTVTGGLPFFGGPGNSYSLHAIVEMMHRLQQRPDELGLITANGGYLSKQSVGIYSTRPPNGHWRRGDVTPSHRRLAAVTRPSLSTEPSGRGRIETYTVAFDRSGPVRGIVVGRLEDDRRFVANTPADDREALDALMHEGLGSTGRVHATETGNVFELG